MSLAVNDSFLMGKKILHAVLGINPRYNSHFKSWAAKQSLPVQTAIITGIAATRSACLAFFVDIIFNDYPPSFDPQSCPVPGGYQPLVHQMLGGGPVIMARNAAIRASVAKSVGFVMEKLRGKTDLYSEAVTGFSSGIVLSLASGMKGPSVLSIGFLFALTEIGWFKALGGEITHDVFSS